MKALRKIVVFTSCFLLSFIFVGASFAARDIRFDKHPEEFRLAQKADLIVLAIQIKKLDKIITLEGIKHKVKLYVTIKNVATGPLAASTTTASKDGDGYIKFKIEWSDHPLSGFNYLTHAPCVPLKPGHSRTITFNDFIDYVPFKVARTYRVNVDYVEWIREWNEGNNINSAKYVAR